MCDVRARLGVKSVQWKIEKRVLERVGHVMRMKDKSGCAWRVQEVGRDK